MASLPELDAHQEAEKLWLRWSTSKRKNERKDAILRLWILCEPVIWNAAKEIANKLGRLSNRRITVPEWRLRHGLDSADVENIAYLAVANAAKTFDPRKGAFQTYVRNFILGELRRWIATQDPLDRPELRSDVEAPDREDDEHFADTEDLRMGLRMSWLLGSGANARRAQLSELDPDSLNVLFGWLNKNADRAIRDHGFYEFHDLRSWVASVCWLKMLRKGTLRPKDRGPDLLRMRVTKIEDDGRTRDLTVPLTARALLGFRRHRFSERDMAALLGMSQKGYRGLRSRIEERGLDVLDGVTLEDLDHTVRGKRRGPKGKQ